MSEPITITRLSRWLSGKESACQCKRRGFNPCVRKIPWRRKWHPTPAFLSGKFHRQRNLWAIVHIIRKSWTQLNTRMDHSYYLSFAFGSVVKNPPASARNMSLIPESVRSPGEGYSNPFQYSCLENPMDRGAWQVTFYGVPKKLYMT